MVDELLDHVDLADWRHKMVGTFSGGMRRRLEIARSLMHQPQILFLDEPTSGLDPASRLAMWDMLRRLRRQTGFTLFLTTHYMEEADQLCDRLAIFDRGRIVASGTPGELKSATPSSAVIELEFGRVPPGWREHLASLPAAVGVERQDRVFRIESRDRMETVAAAVAMARRHGVAVTSLVARGSSLEDVYLRYTGRDLRDAADGKVRREVAHLYESARA
jgi:ABC-2 type transport system ATP-binding protein